MTKSERERRLMWAIQALAAMAHDQLSLFPAFVCKGQELSLDFDEAVSLIKDHDSESLTAAQVDSLQAIGTAFAHFGWGGPAYNPDLWTDEGVRTSVHWEGIRALAHKALNAWGWPNELPPPDPGDRGVTYVPAGPA